MPRLILTDELRLALKKPLGRLLPGEDAGIYEEIRRLTSLKRPPRVIFVGDTVSRRAVSSHLRADLLILDYREMRTQTKGFDTPARKIFHVRNEPGTVGIEAWGAIRDAVKSRNVLMIVDGEEDLLTLVAIAEAPDGSFVIYGQPGEGVVLVEVEDRTRKTALGLLERMSTAG